MQESSHPSRSLQVSGTCRSDALMRSTMRSVLSGSHSSLLPPSRLVTLSTGQPMLMSTTCAPRSSAHRAASQRRSTFAAVKLHAQRRILLGRSAPSSIECWFSPQHAFGAEQVGAGQPDAAARARDEPEREIAVARDRREQQVRREFEICDFEHAEIISCGLE